MTIVLGVISGKGGVGKTTTSINLATALSEAGYNVYLVDGNLTTPNVSLHLGIPLYPVTLHDVMKGGAEIHEAIYKHGSGVNIIPASLSVDDLDDMQIHKLKQAVHKLTAKKGIVIIDGSAGLGRETRAIIEISDSVLIVTNPELPAVTDALKAIKVSKKMRCPVMGIILNRHRGRTHEMSREEIISMLESPILGTIREDINVPRSITAKEPVVRHSPRSYSAQCYRKLAANLMGYKHDEETMGIFESILNWLKY